jgi:hypothetical protein
MISTPKFSIAAKMLATAGLGLALFLAVPAGAKPDAVSAASLSVSADSVKQTTARISYFNDRYNYGSRTLCYNPAPAAPTLNCVTKTASGNSGFFNVINLTPFTAYNFSIKAINTRDQADAPYTTSGSFTTLDTLKPPPDTIPTPPPDTVPILIRGAGAKTGVRTSGAPHFYDLRGRKSGEHTQAAAGGLVPVPSAEGAHSTIQAP